MVPVPGRLSGERDSVCCIECSVEGFVTVMFLNIQAHEKDHGDNTDVEKYKNDNPPYIHCVPPFLKKR